MLFPAGLLVFVGLGFLFGLLVGFPMGLGLSMLSGFVDRIPSACPTAVMKCVALPSRFNVDASCMRRLNWAISSGVVHDGIFSASTKRADRVAYWAYMWVDTKPSTVQLREERAGLAMLFRNRSNCSHTRFATKLHVLMDQWGKPVNTLLTFCAIVSHSVRTSVPRSKISAVMCNIVRMIWRHNSGSLFV